MQNPSRMAHAVLSLILLLLWLPTYAGEFSANLRSSDHVLLIRHAIAPGVGDPPNYSLSDCSTQRNLDARGRRQAVALGEWLRRQGVQSAKVYSSVWCRCRDTAKLLGFDGDQVEPALASFFDDMSQAEKQNRQLEQFIAGALRTKGDRTVILVTHHVNIFQFTGVNVASGALVLARVDRNGKHLGHQILELDEPAETPLNRRIPVGAEQ